MVVGGGLNVDTFIHLYYLETKLFGGGRGANGSLSEREEIQRIRGLSRNQPYLSE